MKIIEIDQRHEFRSKILILAESIDYRQVTYLTHQKKWMVNDVVLAAIDNDNMIGYIRFTVSELGANQRSDPVIFEGEPLIEAFGEAFGVLPSYRDNGTGRALQIEAMGRARLLGCYQYRSMVPPEAVACSHLKLSLGFAIQPERRGRAYFIKVL